MGLVWKSTISALMLGFLVGALVLGGLADRGGRKRNLVLTLLGMVFFNLVYASTSDYSVYVLARSALIKLYIPTRLARYTK